MPSPVQSNCDAHDTIANGQYGAVWSMGHTQQVCVRIVLLTSNIWQQFFGRSAFLRQQETDLPPVSQRSDGNFKISVEDTRKAFSLAIISIESEISEKMDFTETIDKLASQKARKVTL
ncbi:hypothetical protein TNCV_1085651 [Trichonephila clavipes]|nr:hypothetical protein TNCV_1085651 [Trichonephila clavipes]